MRARRCCSEARISQRFETHVMNNNNKIKYKRCAVPLDGGEDAGGMCAGVFAGRPAVRAAETEVLKCGEVLKKKKNNNKTRPQM